MEAHAWMRKQRDDALEMLRLAERRLRRIEDLVEHGTTGDPDLATFIDELKEHLPWDDANEHGSWYFSHDEACRD